VHHDRVEPWTGPPPMLWVMEGLLPVVWGVLLLWLIVVSVRRREATLGLLVLISFSSIFWQDAYINWGMYLLYNPGQPLMPWGTTPFTAPRKVWWTVFAYGIFWLAAIPGVMALADRLRQRVPSVNRTAAVFLVGIPAFYVWDLLFEGAAVNGRFYSYVSYWGPAVTMDGGNMPLLFPILFIAASGTAFVWLVGWRGPDGRARFEDWFRLSRIGPGLPREAGRVIVWILVINVVHIVLCIVPLTAIRIMFLAPSPLVP
jgi:hypothetical protein